ncbi:di-heme oxidoredictase family protein [Achromobacter animicus]|uniref:di-heme oxidoreductase family protein n=1 Tax=Achromobacter animicus TaxID=1389935 RepID=UPI003C7D5493
MKLALAAVLAASVHAVAAAAPAAPGGRDDLTPEDQKRVTAITAPTSDFSKVESFETMQAGATTTNKLINADIFSQPSANMSFEGRQEFIVGNGLFRKDWVSAPSSTQASDGLGPLFNARSCQACHTKDGRGTVPGFDPLERTDAVALLLRLAVPEGADRGHPKLGADEIAALPEPVYGVQLQNFAVAGLPAEGRMEIEYEAVPVALRGGETATLMKPTYRIENLGYGPMRADTQISPRLAPPMIGLGLLESIHESDILANVGADKRDGIVGKANWVTDARTGARVLGRFNLKAGQPTVEQQSAAAFSNDMGLSTPLFPEHSGECTPAQTQCLDMPHGAQPRFGPEEVPGKLMDFVTIYSTNLAVPMRRDADDARVLAGKKLFYEANCVACHVPKYVTSRNAKQPEHRFQLIWPYTDMLVHDMGDDLADGVSDGMATGREWRTPPLWGIGLTKTVNPNATWLHDGRARTLLEAVLWHGGAAKPARDRVVDMTPEERADLIRFLESL